MPPLLDHNHQNTSGSTSFDYRMLLPTSYNPLNSNKPPIPHSAVDEYLLHDDEASSSHLSPPLSSWWNRTSSYDVQADQEDSWFCGELTFRERMLGFGTCLLAGYMLSFGSFWRIRDLVVGNPYPLVLHTMVGNLLTWAGSFFLVGPKTQWKRLWEAKRKLATKVYLTSLALMLVIILLHPPGPEGLFLFILILMQNGAMAWYCLSYIPFAHETIQGYASRFVSTASDNDFDLSYMPALST